MEKNYKYLLNKILFLLLQLNGILIGYKESKSRSIDGPYKRNQFYCDYRKKERVKSFKIYSKVIRKEFKCKFIYPTINLSKSFEFLF